MEMEQGLMVSPLLPQREQGLPGPTAAEAQAGSKAEAKGEAEAPAESAASVKTTDVRHLSDPTHIKYLSCSV